MLTAEQQKTVDELRKEIRDLNLQADAEWVKYLHTGDEACYNEVLALDAEIEMKGLIAYIPKVGERKISAIRNALDRVKAAGGKKQKKVLLKSWEARIQSLEMINAWREDLGLPPLDRLPRGIPTNPSECTLAKAVRLTAKELGLVDITVSVHGGDDIMIAGYDKDQNRIQIDPPQLNGPGDAVIQYFDEAVWPDLLGDHELIRHAARPSVTISELEGISKEMTRRGLTGDIRRWFGGQPINISLGSGVSVQEQIDQTGLTKLV